MEGMISLDVKNLPYKKMNGLLKTLRIDPSRVALEVSPDFATYIPLKNWQDYLPFSHKVSSVVLFKKHSLYLFVGYSSDDTTIIYNPAFSAFLLKKGVQYPVKQLDFNKEVSVRKNRIYSKKDKTGQLDIILDAILDKISRHGISSLTEEEIKQLDNLSNQ